MKLTSTGLLGVVFVTLKLCGVISWSWWWVMCPFWIGIAIWLSVALFALCVHVFCIVFKDSP